MGCLQLHRGIEPLPGGAKTNDHFLATLKGTGASPGGKVSIGVSNSGARVTTIVTVSKAGATTPGVTLAAAIANGSSAEQEVEASTLSARQVNRVYAASTLDPTTTGTVTLFEFDRGWSGSPTASTVPLSTADVNYSMATEVTLGQQGQRRVTYRKIDPLQKKVQEGERQPDDGRIARQWFGAFTSGTSEEELVTSNIAARPREPPRTPRSKHVTSGATMGERRTSGPRGQAAALCSRSCFQLIGSRLPSSDFRVVAIRGSTHASQS